MPRNPKRRQRVLLIIGVVATLGVAAVGTYYGRRWTLDQKALADREAGRAALKEGKYEEAMAATGNYIKRLGWRDATVNDYVDYAKAREAVPLPKQQHLIEAMGVLKRGLDKDPNSREAQEQLLSLYIRTGFASEALDLTDKLLATTPDDVKVLRQRADVLEGGLRRLKDALDVAKTIAARKDSTHDDLLRVLRLLVRTETAAGDMNAWITATAAAHPGDQFVELMRAIVLSMRGDTAGANAILDRIVASTTPTDDPLSLAFLMQALDGSGRFSDTLRLLERLNDVPDAALRREIVRRLWYGGRAEDMLARIEKWEGDRKTADAETLAMHALGLLALGRRTEADPILEELAARTDAPAKAWSTVARIGAGSLPGGTAAAIVALTDASRAVPDSAVIQCALGNAAAEAGEWDTAVWAWSVAGSRAIAWSVPLAGLSRAYRLTRKPEQAARAGRAALARAPSNVEAVRAWVDASAELARTAPPAAVADFLKQLTSAETEDARVADITLPVRVDLLARTDRAMAQAVVQGALDSKAPLQEGTLLRLVAIVVANGIPLESKLLAHSESLHGVSPRLAVADAVVRARAGNPEDGVRAFDAMRAKAPAGASEVDWGMARAGLLDGLANPGAGAAWAAVAEANPTVLQAQLGALASASFTADREATSRVIDRIKGLTGESGVTWRNARAQWLLDAPSATAEDVTNAADLLTAVVRQAPDNLVARIRLAQALERSDDLKGAETHLQAAAAIAPDNAAIGLELARVSHRQGRGTEARQKLDRVLATKGLAPELSQRAAFLLAAEGDLGRSADLLQQLMSESRTDRDGTLLLAKIYGKQGKTAEAIRLCETILDRPTPPMIELAAHLYATAGRQSDAESVLARLDGMGLPPGDVEIARGRYAARWSPPGVAQDWFRKATEAAPTRADAWAARAGSALMSGDRALLTTVLQDPRAAVSDDVQYLAANTDLCDAAATDMGVRAVLFAALGDKPARPAITKALRAMVKDWPDRTKRVEVARSVVEIADANASVLTLQLCAADVLAQTGNLRSACDRTQRAATAFPDSALAARRNAELLHQSERWTDALEAGRVWKERADAQDRDADQFLAQTMLRIGRASDAAAQLDPRIKAAVARPEGNEKILLLHCVALVRTGRAADAERRLRELAKTSEKWSTLPLSVESNLMGSSADAVAWMGLCTSLAPQNNPMTRTLLAQSWVAAASHFRTDDVLSRAKAAVAAALAAPGAPPEVHFLAGSLAQSANDLETARTEYETMLKLKPEFDVARNNLAMVLADTGKATEAVEHATRVAKTHAQSSEALDTLAYALRKAKDFEASKARLAEAIALDPANPTWQVSLAETIAEAGDVSALTQVLAQIRKMEDAGAVISPELRTRIDKFRAKR